MNSAIQEHFKGRFEIFYGKYLPEIKKLGGDEYIGLCPFHEDKNPSLNFNSKTGAYLCRGCGKKGGFFHFYGRINGLDTRRDFPKILKGISKDFGIPWEEVKSKIIATYDYTDPVGNLLFQVCRMEPKDFRQRQPGQNGKWIWNLKGIEPVLYRLPNMLKAQEVIIVEGEKDADCLAALGFCATTCPMGAKKWRPEYNDSLKGKDIVLIPDNDNEGREHMAQVAMSLNGASQSLKWIDLPGVPSKGDLSDWVERIGDKETAAEQLATMINRAGPYEPPKKTSLEDAIIITNEFDRIDLESKKVFIEPWLTEQSISLVSGWRGTGKTWFALSVLGAVAKGEPFGPWETKTSVPCLFLDGEMPVPDIAERLRMLSLNSTTQNPVYIYSDAYSNQLGLRRAHLAHENWRRDMKRILTTRRVKLWVIDNLASLASGLDENSKKDWDPINAWLLELRFAGISTIMLHHVGKEGQQRGTSAREDNIDNSITLKPPRDYVPEDGARFILHFSKARVATEYLPLVTDHEFKLARENQDQTVWIYGSVKKELRKAILKLLDEGLDVKSICETLDTTKGYVSKVRNKAVKDGLLTSKGKLTQDGFLAVNED